MNNLLLDIQTAYGNGINKIEFLESYLSLNGIDDIKDLLILKNLQIFPVNDTLKFTGDLMDLKFTEQEKQQIQKANNKNLLLKFLYEKAQENFTMKNEDILTDKLTEKLLYDLDNFECAIESNDNPYENDISIKEAPESIKEIHKVIKRFFKNIRIIKFDDNKYTITSDMKSICLSHGQLELLFELAFIYNLEFKILAKYNYEDDNDELAHGVKFLWNFVEN